MPEILDIGMKAREISENHFDFLCIFSLQNTYLLYRGCQINILLFDYRGYGKSTGTPSESGLYIDAQAVYDYVRQRTDLNQEKIVFFGRSLGGGVALHLGKSIISIKIIIFFFLFLIAAHLSESDAIPPLYAVIVENTFTSIADMAKRLFQVFILDYIPIWCYKNVVSRKFSSNNFLEL